MPLRNAVILAAICWPHLASGLSASEPKFNVVAKRADDRIEISSNNEATTISVRSPFGISSAVVKRVDDLWPNRVILRLYLQGLEGLKLSNGKVDLVAEASGQDNKKYLHLRSNSTQSQESGTTKLAGTEIRSFDKDGTPTNAAPVKNGYFEVRLPQELFAGNPESITINWIDFYR